MTRGKEDKDQKRAQEPQENEEDELLTPQSHIVEMNSSLDGLNLSSQVQSLHALPEVSNSRVSDIVGSKDGLSLLGLVESVDVLDGEDGEDDVVSRVSKSDSGSGSEREVGNVFGRDVEGDGHREESSGSESVGSEDAVRSEGGVSLSANFKWIASSRARYS